jgi:hypothetical protein
MSTTTVGTSQSSGGDQLLNTNPPPSPQVNQDEAKLNQIKVQDWDEVEEDEVEAEENDLIRVQHEIERSHPTRRGSQIAHQQGAQEAGRITVHC